MSAGSEGGKRPLYRKLCDEIRRDIASGIYQPGEVLPSIREMARTRGVARNTVDAAYQILAEEGYIRSKRGVGYVVLDLSQSFHGQSMSYEEIVGNVADLPELSEERLLCDFRHPVLMTEYFTQRSWNRMFSDVYRELAGQPEDTGKALRKQIRRYLKKHRGIACSDEQIYLCGSLPQAVQMIRRVHPNLLYVVTHHQGTLGNHISREEEERLLSKRGTFCILEDDIDSELVYGKRPYPTLFERDKEGRVILTGTFERTVGSILQVHYVVFPERILRERREIFETMGRGENYSLLEFKALEILMRSEYWEGFLRKVNRLYAAKRDVLTKSLKRQFQDNVVLYRTESGPELIAAFPYRNDAETAVRDAAEKGLGITARTGQEAGDGAKMLYVTLRFASVPDEAIEKGAATLAEVVPILK